MLRKLGEGGMGVVYEAEQDAPRRRVALKVVRGGAAVSDTTIRLFQREVRTLALLEHPRIASIYSSGSTPEGQHWFAMELVRGTKLDEWLGARRPGEGWSADGLRSALALFGQICEAVSYAHQRGVIHRDLKPANILVTEEPAPEPASISGSRLPGIKILDFGLARITDADVSMTASLTDLGLGCGTLQYMSPEQLRGNPDEIDVRSDIYSLGVVLYEMLAGTSPYDFASVLPHEVARVILVDPPRPLSRTRGGARRLDSDVATIVHKALEKDPARRYASAAAFADDVQRYLANQPILARAPSAFYQLRKLVARYRLRFAALAALVALVGAFGVGMGLLARKTAEERDRANREAARAESEARAAQQITGILASFVGANVVGDTPVGPSFPSTDLAARLDPIIEALADRPREQAALLAQIANVFNSRGEYRITVGYIERAIAASRSLGPAGEETAAAYHGVLVEAYWGVGRWDDAERAARALLGTLERTGETQGVLAATMHENLGVFLRERGRLDEAERQFDAAARTYDRVGWPHLTGSLADSRGNLRLRQGRYAAAEQEFRRAYETFSAVNARTAPAFRALAGIGRACLRLGKLDEAEDALRRARTIIEDQLSPTSLDGALIAVAFGELHLARGRAAQAARGLAPAIASLESNLGPEHPLLAEPLGLLAHATERTEGRAAALPIAERALAIRRRTLGAGSPLLAPFVDHVAKLRR